MQVKSYDKYIGDDEVYFDENIFPKTNSLRQDHELFDDNDYIPNDLINIKCVEGNGSDYDWEIYKNGECELVLHGYRFKKNEKQFMQTPDGMNFIIVGFKSGWKNVSEFKRQIEKYLRQT